MLPPLKVVMTLDDRDFNVKVERAGRTIRTLNTEVARTGRVVRESEGHLKAFGARFQDLVFTISLARFAFHDLHQFVLALPIAFTKAAGEMERMTLLLEGLSKETDNLKRRAEALNDVSFIYDLAANTPFKLATLTDMFVKLKSTGIDPANGSIQALVGSLSKFGATDEMAKRASIAIQQMSGKGVISMEELRQQLGEAIPNAMEMMARGMGISIAELTKEVSKGAVEANSALKKMFAMMAIDSLGATERMKKTLPGMLNQTAVAWNKLLVTMGTSGLDSIVKKQLEILIKFMNSADGQQFARDVGEGFATAARAVVALKDGLLQAMPVITMIGKAWLLYFGAKQINDVRAAMFTYFEQAKAQQAALAAEKSKEFQKEIDIANDRIDQNERMKKAQLDRIDTVLSEERKAHAAKINQAKEELVKIQANQRDRVEQMRRLSAREMDLRRRASAFDNQAASLGNSGSSRDRALAQRYRDQADALKATATNYDRVVGEIHRNLKAEVDLQKTKIDSLRTDRSYMQVAAQRRDAIRQGARALDEASAAQRQHIAAQEQAIQRANSATAAVLGFGRALAGSVVWTAGFMAVMAVLYKGWDMLTEKTRKATAAQEAFSALQRGEVTRDNVTKTEDQLKVLDKDIADKEKELGRVNRANSSNFGNSATAQRKAQVEAELEQMRKDYQVKRDFLAKSKNDLIIQEGKSAGEIIASQASNAAELEAQQTKEYTAWKQNSERLMKAKEDASKAGQAMQKKLAEEDVKLALNFLDKQEQIINREYSERLKRSGGANQAEVNALMEARRRELEVIQGRKDALRSPNVIGFGSKDDKKAAAAALREDAFQAKESPLWKAVQAQKADFYQAKSEWETLGSETRDFTRNAQYKATAEILAKLAAGDFDINPSTRDPNGLAPGGANRGDLLKSFDEFMAAGGNAMDFVKSKVEGLDVSLRENEPTVRRLMEQYVQLATDKAMAAESAKAIGAIMSKEAQTTQELADATAQYRTGLQFLPPAVATLSREFAGLTAKARASSEAMKEVSEAQGRAMANRIEAEELQVAEELARSLEEVQIDSIVNQRDREQAAHDLRLRQMDTAKAAYIDYINTLNLKDESRLRLIGMVEANAAQRRLVEQRRFLLESKSDLDLLIENYTDLNARIDDVVVDSTRNWADAIADFCTGTEVEFDKLIISTLANFAKLKIQEMIAPGIGAGFDALGNVVRGLYGAAGSQPNAAIGYTGSNGPNNPSAFVNMGDAAAQATAAMQTMKAQGVEQLTTSLASSTMATSLETDATTSAVASGQMMVSSMNETTAALWSLKFAAENAAAASAAGTLYGYGYANGGIMTPSGPLPLRAYARGGIATSPQVALFGEGSMNEAYVPLPDGRSIPVTMNSQPAMSVANVEINLINQSGQSMTAQKQGQRFDGEKLIVDMVISNMQRPGPLRDSVRSTART